MDQHIASLTPQSTLECLSHLPVHTLLYSTWVEVQYHRSWGLGVETIYIFKHGLHSIRSNFGFNILLKDTANARGGNQTSDPQIRGRPSVP